jgi:hypothetical protein
VEVPDDLVDAQQRTSRQRRSRAEPEPAAKKAAGDDAWSQLIVAMADAGVGKTEVQSFLGGQFTVAALRSWLAEEPFDGVDRTPERLVEMVVETRALFNGEDS